jgi:hypothetical protein
MPKAGSCQREEILALHNGHQNPFKGPNVIISRIQHIKLTEQSDHVFKTSTHHVYTAANV